MSLARDRIPVQLVAIEYGAPNVNLYRFRAAYGESLPAASAGAHIVLEVGADVRRSYSLIDTGTERSEYAIAVLLQADGRGGSRAWHRESVVGDIYWISPPSNNFRLSEAPGESYLFAGGIGITPIYSMFRALKGQGKPARLFYWVRSREHALFVEELQSDPEVRIIETGENPASCLRISQALNSVPREAHLYCCGPRRMLLEFQEVASARPAHLVHSEQFAGDRGAVEANAQSFIVRLARSNASIEVQPGQSILQACLAHGLDVAYSCEEGICGACEVPVIEGRVLHLDSFRTPAEHEALRTIMICSSVSAAGELVLDL